MTRSQHLPMLGVLLLLQLAHLPQAELLVLTADQKTETVNAHNQLRRSVYPQASNMNFLTWNTRLEILAQQAANSCVFAHNYGGDYAPLGENLYQGGRTNATEIIMAFFMEQAGYNYDTSQCNRPNVFGYTTCGHYLQVVGATVLEVGCAINSCPAGNLFVCEYDKMHSSLVYIAGKPCSNCSAGFCLDGLCLNGTMRDIYAASPYNYNATCSLNCQNCGLKGVLIGLSPSICACKCKSGYSGADCSYKLRANPPALTCSACTQRNTPCLNGGIENSTNITGIVNNCSCVCPSTFTGPQCQLSVDAYRNAVYFQFKSTNIFCFNGKCSAVPLNPVSFASQIWPRLQQVLVTSINDYCRSASNFAQCCPGVTPPGGGPTGNLLRLSDMMYVDFSVQLNSQGNLGVAVYGMAQSDNTLCPASSRRRRRAAATTSAVPMTVLSGTISSSNATISGNLTASCGIIVDSAVEYKAVADSQFSISSTDGATTSAADGGSTVSSVGLSSVTTVAAVGGSVNGSKSGSDTTVSTVGSGSSNTANNGSVTTVPAIGGG